VVRVQNIDGLEGSDQYGKISLMGEWVMLSKFEWVEHTADIGFKAYGRSLEGAFENAALALTEIITSLEDVKAENKVNIKIVSEDIESLLFDWLDHFLYLFDAKELIHSRFEISEISEKDGEFKLVASAWGEKFDPKKHALGTEVKAITYHMMEIGQSEEQCFVQVIVDI